MAHFLFMFLPVLVFAITLVISLGELSADNLRTSSEDYIRSVEDSSRPTLPVSAKPLAKPGVSFVGMGDTFLFINGQFSGRVTGWNNVGNAYHTLNIGDVVAVYARGVSPNNGGFIATVYFDNHQISTGGKHWKAIGLSQKTLKYVRHWRTNKGSSCQWPAPITRPLRKLYARELRRFPPSAEVVWANGANRRNAVLFRYVVGGETCTTHWPSITFAANDMAWLYVDGKFLEKASHWNEVKVVHAKLAKGSVVALKVRNSVGWYGVIADVTLSTRQHMVTGQPVWKAIRGYMKDRLNPSGWRTEPFSSCHWPVATKIPMKRQRGVAKTFPYKHGARYVWADKTDGKSVILLRYVIGGEHCRKQTRIYIRSRAPSWVYFNGRLAAYVRRGGKRTLYRNVEKGDVIGVLSKGRRRRGVLLAMRGPLGYMYSGEPGWKGNTGWGPRGWATKTYSSCGWNRAVVLGKIRDQFAPKSRMIWGSRRRERISLVRYVVGGEECSSIKYESKGPARLYVNSHRVFAHRTKRNAWSVRTVLTKGDVVGIIGYGTPENGKGAIRAVVKVKGKHYATGKSEWRVNRLPRNAAWTRRGFHACKWGAGKVVEGWKRFGDSSVAAKALWATGKATALRFVVGGDSCRLPEEPEQSPGSMKKAVVTLTGDNEATLFLNGNAILSTTSWRSVAKAVVDVKQGDVFGVHAKDGGLWFGVRVGLVVDGEEMGTGVGEWRGRGASGAGEAWKLTNFDGCGWMKVVNAADVDRVFEHGAPRFEGLSKFVWVSGTGAGEDVIGRLVLGGSC